jgi:hypothetical protein
VRHRGKGHHRFDAIVAHAPSTELLNYGRIVPEFQGVAFKQLGGIEQNIDLRGAALGEGVKINRSPRQGQGDIAPSRTTGRDAVNSPVAMPSTPLVTHLLGRGESS